MEKENEIFLSNLLLEFPKQYIFYSTCKNKDLKEIFSKASKKSESGRGEPDRIIYDGSSLLIFEVKSKFINNAIKDLKIYKNKMNLKNYKHLNIFFIPFINDQEYKVFDKEFREIDLLLKPENFKMNINEKLEICINKELKLIHQYIYDNMSISNDDKAFLIAIILIGIKSEIFCNTIQNLNKNDEIGIYNELIKIISYYQINVSNFEFLQNSGNNKHLYWLIKKCIKLFRDTKNNFDLISSFYNEFLKYNNDSLKSVGCVLTPNYCSEIMTELLNINKDDTILDLCAGTGTLIFQCNLKNPYKLIACELQTKLVTLLQCQKILLDNKNIEIKNGDCFQFNFNATKSIINPPYGEQINELEFCSKQLDSIPDGGLAVSIIPVGKINSPSKYRNKIFENAKICKIIIMNEKLFYPYAAPHCAILLLEKCKNGHDKDKDFVKIYNFKDDGYETKIHYGRVNVEFKKKKLELFEKLNLISGIQIKKDSFWLDEYFNFNDKKINQNILFLQREIEKEMKIRLEKINNINLIENYFEKEFLLNDLFEIIKKPYFHYDEKVAVVSAKNNNNGIVKYEYSLDKKVFPHFNFVAVTGGNGGAGLVYFMSEPFLIESATIVLKPKFEINDNDIGEFIACIFSAKFKNKYSRSNGWSQQKMKQDTILLPCTENGYIDFITIKNTIQKLKSI